MKLATLNRGEKRIVVEYDEPGRRFWPVIGANGLPAHDIDMLELIRLTSDGLREVTRLDSPIPRDSASLASPIPRPLRNIFCVGKNYREHAKEFASSGFDASSSGAADVVPEYPIVFSKVPESVISDGEPILYPEGVSKKLDYEAELGVVIGRGGRGIPKHEAMAHVWGYTIINDVTARDLQAQHKQWLLGKSLDTFAPMGPVLVTANELDGAALDVKCWVNGDLRQEANTRDLIFDIPTLIAEISAGLTLYPGDVIATGTPAGVGIGFDPPRFLQRGDTVAIEITGIGTLTNTVA